MLNSDMLKSKIDNIPKEYYGVVFEILKSIEKSKKIQHKHLASSKINYKVSENWSKFISQTYGSLSDFPIERGTQGKYESREEMI
ncbi:MAG TPA: hypothetical protein ENI57_07545 [Ignavibacteria bacterium]|nr:hypothetical protein [Ignavibacteria bacterium]